MKNLPELYHSKYFETDNYYHGKPISAEVLLTEIKMAGVNMTLAWLNPAVTPYGNDKKKNFETLLKASRYFFDTDGEYPNPSSKA